jgi:Zn-dependent protease with chaperone function
MTCEHREHNKARSTLQRERFENLVAEAERLLESRPRAYRIRLASLAVLGYAVIFGILFLLIALIAGSVWAALTSTVVLLILIKKKLIIVLALIAWVLIKSLWVRSEPPRGYEIRREHAPALFRDLDVYRRRLATPKIHAVLLSQEFNAGILRTPRLGVLGWHRNTLILGLPLLMALQLDEARAVVAHELGHLSGNHSRFNGWIYRIRITWYRLMESFDQATGFGTGLMRRFFDWYAPYFDAYSFALARANEYEADAIAAELTSTRAVAGALVNSDVRAGLIDQHFWQKMIANADRQPAPTSRPYSDLRTFCRQQRFDHADVQARLDLALEEKTGHADTHPALKERLAAIGHSPADIQIVGKNAAELWLGDDYGRILEEFDGFWLEQNRPAWRQRFEHVRAAGERMTELKSRDRNSLTADEIWQLATLTEEFDPNSDALPIYQQYSEKSPKDPDAAFAIGRILLDRGDESGIAYMEQATESLWLAVTACELLCSFHLHQGDTESANRWRLRGEHFLDRELEARQERELVAPADEFAPAKLDHDTMLLLRRQLLEFPRIRGAWIAEKRLKHAAQSPVYVLSFKTTWFCNDGKMAQKLADEIQFPQAIFFASLSGDTAALAKKVRKHGVDVLCHAA